MDKSKVNILNNTDIEYIEKTYYMLKMEILII